MMHVANDLALGLDLSLDQCNKMLTDGTLAKAIMERREYIDFPATHGKVRRIPMASFETIIDLRLRELLEIIRSSIDPESLSMINSGVVLTGGGASFEVAQKITKDVFRSTVRVGRPTTAVGVVTDLADPRYSAVWGALKIAAYYQQNDSNDSDNILVKVLKMGDSVRHTFRTVKDSVLESFKI